MRERLLIATVIFNLFLIAGCATQTTVLIGLWEDIEAENLHIEFEQFRFREYLFGEIVSYGTYEASYGNLTLHYESACGGPGQGQCAVRLGYDVSSNTLIITDSIGDLVFRRVE